METKKTKPIIVPWGLTLMSEIAFQHAVGIAKAANTGIALVRLATNQNLIKEIEEDLGQVAVDLEKKYGIKPEVIVTEGSVYKRFTQLAEEHGSNLIIKHINRDISGMEKITGSKSLKIIAGSMVPYIVVQNPPKRDTIERIVLPIDHTVETKEKLLWLVYFARFCQPFVHIITPKTIDGKKLKYIKNNVSFARNLLEEKGVKYDISISQNDDFGKTFIDFAHKKDADLIIMMLPKDLGFGSLLFGSKEQDMITNEYGIPIMCVNPRTDLKNVNWK
ncbi:MAG TPA: hypothetical protein DDX39_00875 [Bacteroidales bacterium]|nr:MAG: hypothetical protein A2W98_06460 [Bacteroidetes bacterium GWF2_33_38]OFY73150.1 MAG: hypothetical protein A2265_06155 [Bacteroidetes bacterium RIFOXYA12_FULL_33_9]OFY92320.1 MAG: hypothetical protein A2236_01780 [Bacteroidetes bacterium RIFOXYA2_FULL_33_7]HBF87164.1 hypothetical protein [Bacteroidales bacterium]